MNIEYVHGILSRENQLPFMILLANPDWLPTIHMGHKKGKPIDTER